MEDKVKTSSVTVPVYHCIIDGKPEIMSALDFAYAIYHDHKTGTKGSYAGERPLEDPPPEPGEIERIRDEILAEMREKRNKVEKG